MIGTFDQIAGLPLPLLRRSRCAGRNFQFPNEIDHVELDVRSVLDKSVDSKYDMSDKELSWLDMWEEFLINVNKK